MKNLTVTVALLMLFCTGTFSQNFTWMRGSATSSVLGNYGTLGSPSSANDPGGRHGCATWVDLSGNLWLFGGEGYSSVSGVCWLNDLWKYNITTNQWTWMGGSNLQNQVGNYGVMGTPAASNQPGAREFAITWVDASGNFWMFGGDGYNTSAFGRLNDLWKYNPTTNQWTWINGSNTLNASGVYGTQGTPSSSNQPGAKRGAATWTDASGMLLMFGGRGYGSASTYGFLNDLWKYNPGTNQWTWINGNTIVAQNGVYGTFNVPSTSNTPGSREMPAYWIDASGIFYIFGGLGFPISGTPGYMGDLWKYDPAANTWTWLGGPNTINPLGIYGTMGVAASSNSPGGRLSTASWKDASGNFFMFGGFGYGSSALSRLNDLWKYDPVTNQWTWMKGTTQINQPGVYGTVGVAAPTNHPGSRDNNTWWKGTTSKFWLFGGEGFDSTTVNQSPYNHMNDLWVYTPPCSPDSVHAIPGKKICSGSSVTLTAYNQIQSAVEWYSSATSTTSMGSGTVFPTPPLTAVSGQSVYSYYPVSNSCTLTPRAAVSISVDPLPNLTINGPTVACSGSPVTMTASGAATYTWNTGSNLSTATLTPGYTFVLLGTDTNGCENSVFKSVTALSLPNLSVSASPTAICKHGTSTLSVSGASTYSWSNTLIAQTITVTMTGNTTYTVTGTDTNSCSASKTLAVHVLTCDVNGLREETANDLSFSLYPNPNAGEFTLSFDEPMGSSLKLIIYNAMGEIIFERMIDEQQTSVKSNLTKGIYYYTIQKKDKRNVSGKLVIE
jgi:N-acetylneuraminic acid mutarotase